MKHNFFGRLRYAALSVLFLGISAATSLYAQTPTDSAALANAPWKIVETSEGLIIKKAEMRLFDSDQQIFCVEFNPRMHRLSLSQQENRETVKRLGEQEPTAEVAVNGGYFITKTDKAIANDVTKIDGHVLTSGGGWGNGAIAVDSSGILRLINNLPGLAATDSLWHRPYPNVMGAGPMLVYANTLLIGADYPDPKRHPRTIIGIRPDGIVMLLVVDGRQKGADGMSMLELAYTARILGMSSALNLDGGGSSTLWSRRNKIINRPSDKVAFIRIPRKVGNAVLVVPVGAQ